MTVILFIIVLAILVFAHELGHFLAAKSIGVRVDEFGIGFPPRAYSWKPKNSETTYSINWIPFGGFVKIFKEDEDTKGLSREELARTLNVKPWYQKIWVLCAGVFFNILLAWGLITIGLSIGLPLSVDESTRGVVGEPVVTVVYTEADSPASVAGMISGDAIVGMRDASGNQLEDVSVTAVQEFIASHDAEELTVTILRDDTEETLMVTPATREVDGETRAVIGVVLDTVGIVRLPVWLAAYEGVKTTASALGAVAVGLWEFLSQAVTGKADFSQVAGPVGIAGLTGDAVRLGFVTLLSFMAMLSLNLAVINLIPFPALDGGRVLFVLIETIKRSPISPVVANTLNFIGFVLLITLMVVVTVHDVLKLF